MEKQHQFSSWVITVLWLNIILGGLRGVLSTFSIMIFNPSLGCVTLVLTIIGIFSLVKILDAKRWALFLWMAYILTASIINDIIEGHGYYYYLIFGVFVILLMCLILQIRKDGVSAWSIIFKTSNTPSNTISIDNQNEETENEVSLGGSDAKEKTETSEITFESIEHSTYTIHESSAEKIAPLTSDLVEDIAHAQSESIVKEENENDKQTDTNNHVPEASPSTTKEQDNAPLLLNSEDDLTSDNNIPKESCVKRKSLLWKFIAGIIIAVIMIFGGLYLWNVLENNKSPERLFEKANILFSEGKLSAAMKIYTELADDDYIPAKTRLGHLYLYNDSIPLNHELGIKYLEDSAVFDSTALERLINVYIGIKCKGVDYSDYNKAKYYANMAIKRNQSLQVAYFALGYIYAMDNDYTKAYYYFMESAKKGDSTSYRNLGWMFYWGKGCIKNHTKAKYYFEKALDINANEDFALYYLGLIYDTQYLQSGDKVYHKKAYDYFKRSAELGNEDAQREVAMIEMNSKE